MEIVCLGKIFYFHMSLFFKKYLRKVIFLRALSDQMEGDETHHLEYRKRVCNYMRQNREEFEPFIGLLIDHLIY